MTSIEQVKDSHAEQIRSLNNYCTRIRLITTVNNQRDVRDALHSSGYNLVASKAEMNRVFCHVLSRGNKFSTFSYLDLNFLQSCF